jgi:hypothetical protein
MASNTFMTLTRPMEDAIGNLAMGRWAQAADALSMYSGLARHMRESFRMAGRAWMKDGNILDPVQMIVEHKRGAIPGKAGTVIRTPTRALGAEDEFFKQLNYRAKIHVQAHRQGFGRGLRGKQLAEFIEDRISKSFDETGAATDEAAMKYAEQVTFTNPLGAGTRGQQLQEMVENDPLLRQVFPFVRTPTNLLREAWFHTPGVGLIGRRYRAQWGASPSARATMIGRQTVGFFALGSVFTLAANGQVTGGAPQDRALKGAWLAKHPAYSIKIGDKWFPYDRGDPLGIVLGLAADWMTIVNEVTPADADEFGSAMMLSFMDRLWGDDPLETAGNVATTTGQAAMAAARTVKDKGYFQSLSDLLETIDSGDGNAAAAFLQSRLGSFVPNLLRQTNPDPYFREVRGYVDAILSRVPGLSHRVEPRFDALGRPTMRPGSFLWRLAPTMPIAEGDDPIFREMNRLQQGFLPMASKQGNVDLTIFKDKNGKSAYYYLNELIASSPLEKRLTALIKSPQYQGLSDNVMAGLADIEEKGSKTAAIQKILKEHRGIALDMLKAKHGATLQHNGLTLMKAFVNDEMNQDLAKVPGQAMRPTE